MQFLMSVITDSLDMATEEEMTAITAFNLRLRENNALVFAGGLAGPQESWLLDNRNGRGAIANQPLVEHSEFCLLYTSPSPRDRQKSRMPSSA